MARVDSPDLASDYVLEDFDYHLPEHLIAKEPLNNRVDSRLMQVTPSGSVQHWQFKQLNQLLKPGDLLVLNNSKVMKARLLGHKTSGGQVEVLIERVINPTVALCHVKSNRSPRLGSQIQIGDVLLTLVSRQGRLFQFEFSASVFDLMEQCGHVPLPPYLNRDDNPADIERYQTVYAQHQGSVAAPTAGLHFDQALIDQLKSQGVNIEYCTLHVGAGTFLLVQVDNIKEHVMHEEWFEVSPALVEAIAKTKAYGHRVIACGTTTVRSLESAARTGQLKPYCGNTNIFIFPGFKFQVIDAMITNFHLPKSSLIMLVSAFLGRVDWIQKAYELAIEQQYRFYSYGDAMVLGLDYPG